MVAVLRHLLANTLELSSGLGHDDLHLVVGPLAHGLVLCLELGCELAAASGGLGTGVGNLLVEEPNSGIKSSAGLLGILGDLGRVNSNMLVGLVNTRVDSRGKSGHGALLDLHLVGEILGSLGVSSHLGEHSLLELGTGCLVEGEVTCHL